MNINQIENNTLAIIIPVWGDNYIDYAEELLFFSLIKDKNLPLFLSKCNFESAEILICTREQDIKKFVGKNFKKLRTLINVRFIVSDSCIVERKYSSYSNLIKKGMEESYDKRFLVFCSPDEFYIDGSFGNLSSHIGSVKIFFCSYLRCNDSKTLRDFIKKSKSNIEIINEAILNLHENEKKLNIKSNDFDNRSPSKFFSYSNGGLVSRNFHLPPIFIDKEKDLSKKDLSQFDGTIDDAGFLDKITDGSSKDIYIEQIFSNFGQINLEKKDNIKKTQLKKFSILSFFNFTTRRVGKVHWQLFKKVVYYNFQTNKILDDKKFNFVSQIIIRLEKISYFIYNLRKKFTR